MRLTERRGVVSGRLLFATTEVLKAHRPAGPRFSNMIMAEQWDAAYARGPFRLLPRTDGRFVVVDSRAPLGKASRGDWATLGGAFERLLELWEREGAGARQEAV
jgi:hypothetical protein